MNTITKVFIGAGSILVIFATAGIFAWQRYEGCALWEKNCLAASPRITLNAEPISGQAPLRVQFTVHLSNLPAGHKLLSCPELEWLWGDGINTKMMNECAYPLPKTANGNFSQTYVYTKPGTYKAQVKLGSRAESNIIDISVTR